MDIYDILFPQFMFYPKYEPQREIVDVEYEDITDQIDLPESETKLLENHKQEEYADSDN